MTKVKKDVNNKEKALLLIEQIKEDIVSKISTIKEEREMYKNKINTNSIIYNLFTNRTKYKFNSIVFDEIMNILYIKN